MIRTRLLSIVAATMVMAACGASAGTADDVAAAAAEPASASPVDIGPDLSVLDAGSLEGRDVVVWFWAEW